MLEMIENPKIPNHALIGRKEIIAEFGISKRTISNWIKFNGFPEPIAFPRSKLSKWRIGDIRKYLLARNKTKARAIISPESEQGNEAELKP